MKTGDCLSVTPGEPLNLWQKTGLNLVSRLPRGRDVVLAIDLTGSVNLNDEGRTRLRQIIEDSLQGQDRVYIVLFASDIKSNSSENYLLPQPIYFKGNKEGIETILKAIPSESDPNVQNTDIQKAELFVYQGLAQLNQCRLAENKPVKFQSVVWITDAPLLTSSGISSDVWIETPANSPFRDQNSTESKGRESWVNALPLNKRSQQITTNNNNTYQLSIVDIPATVQEFCTPAPGGKQTCLINGYLLQQLWLPFLIIFLGMMGGGVILKYWLSLTKTWKLEVKMISDEENDKHKYTLKKGQKIGIGGDGMRSITCPGEEIRGYLERKRNTLYLIPTNHAPLYYRGQLLTQKAKIDQPLFKINCPDESKKNQDFELEIKVTKS